MDTEFDNDAAAGAKDDKQGEEKPKSIQDFEKQLDEESGATSVPAPKAKTPEEMMQNPNDVLAGDDVDKSIIDEMGPVQEGSEGQGPHDYSINDNDSKNGPA